MTELESTFTIPKTTRPDKEIPMSFLRLSAIKNPADFISIFSGKILRWIDGDTCVIEVELGFGIVMSQTVRLYGVNCPEMHDPDPKVRDRAELARKFSDDIAPPDSPILAKAEKTGRDKYGRFLADISLPDGKVVANELIAAELGVPYYPK